MENEFSLTPFEKPDFVDDAFVNKIREYFHEKFTVMSDQDRINLLFNYFNIDGTFHEHFVIFYPSAFRKLWEANQKQEKGKNKE